MIAPRQRFLTLVLDLRLLGDLQGVLQLDPKVSDGALELGVPEEELDGSEVLGTPPN